MYCACTEEGEGSWRKTLTIFFAQPRPARVSGAYAATIASIIVQMLHNTRSLRAAQKRLQLLIRVGAKSLLDPSVSVVAFRREPSGIPTVREFMTFYAEINAIFIKCSLERASLIIFNNSFLYSHEFCCFTNPRQ